MTLILDETHFVSAAITTDGGRPFYAALQQAAVGSKTEAFQPSSHSGGC
jgi:hypothetical protein